MARATKEKDTGKEKTMEATAYTTKESPKENSSHGISQKEETKATKERQEECLTKPNKGKGKNPTAVCSRCGQPGHMAKECRTAVYNISETPQEQNQDGTSQWYDPNNVYDNYWYSKDQSGSYGIQPTQQQQQLALPAPPTDSQTPSIHLVATLGQQAASEHRDVTTTMQTPQQQEETQRQRSWSTVVQEHTFAQHGLRQTHHCIHYKKDKVHNWEQQQMRISQCTATNGFSCTTLSKHWLFPFTCVMWHNPLCR